MLQIQRVFSPQIRNREPFATGWWRRERNWKLTFSRQASVFQRAQAYWMRFSAYTTIELRVVRTRFLSDSSDHSKSHCADTARMRKRRMR